MAHEYLKINYAIEGVGNNVNWCAKSGRKKCMLCFNYADYSVWSNDWRFYYILKWKDRYLYEQCAKWDKQIIWSLGRRWTLWRMRGSVRPKNYYTPGLSEYEYKALTKKGCKKKCYCSSIRQRAFWYCPDCWSSINSYAKIKNIHKHDVMLMPRNEIKQELMIIKLSGIGGSF